MDQLIGVVIATVLLYLGYIVGKRNTTVELPKENDPIYCAYSRTESADEEDPYKYEIYPCGNKASVIIPWKGSLCQDHHDMHLAEMSGIPNED